MKTYLPGMPCHLSLKILPHCLLKAATTISRTAAIVRSRFADLQDNPGTCRRIDHQYWVNVS